MPNWCENELTVSGKEKDVLTFVKENRGSEETENGSLPALSLAAKVPLPEDIGEGWYEWCCDNWGTKWDTDEPTCDIADGGESAEYWMTTAWSPPVAWLLTVSKLYPSLRFQLKWVEEGMDESGTSFYQNGREISSDEFSGFSPLIRIEKAEKVTF